MTRLLSSLVIAAVIGAWLAFPAAAAAQVTVGRSVPQAPNAPQVPALMKLRFEREQVVAEIRAVPLQHVLQELAARTGVVFEVGSHENAPVSISLYGVTLAEAVQRIASPNNVMMYYGDGPAGIPRVQYVRIISRLNKPAQPSLIYIGTGAITKTGEDSVDTPQQALRVLAEGTALDLRLKAIEVLVAARDGSAADALSRVLQDPAHEIRSAAAEGLAALSARTTLPGILKLLRDAHPEVRQSAIVAVALLGDAANVKDLERMSRDRDPSVAAAAETAIRKLASRRP